MGSTLLLLAVVHPLVLAPLAPAQSAPPTAIADLAAHQDVFRAALAAVAPSIVRIETIGGALPPAAGGQRPPAFRQGDGPTTGLIWTSDGFVLSSTINFARDPTVITLTLADKRQFIARLVARDTVARVAVLKIDAVDLPTPRWAPVGEVRAGQWALAAGYGFGSDAPALSVGIVSALHRAGGIALQTDAKISPAHYGGPLFDVEGRVLGICAPLGLNEDELANVDLYDSGIAFAVSPERLERLAARLRSGQDVHRGLLGVILRPEGDPPRALRVIQPPTGPAAAAGLLKDDVITHVDDAPVRSTVELRRVLNRKSAGEEVRVRYQRAGATLELALTLATIDALGPPTTQPAASAP